MTDIFTPEKRSWVMSQIRGKNTKIEIKMKKSTQEVKSNLLKMTQKRVVLSGKKKVDKNKLLNVHNRIKH